MRQNENFRTSIPHLTGQMVGFKQNLSTHLKRQNPCNSKGFRECARGETRTLTSVTSQASETCASTNSATRADLLCQMSKVKRQMR